MEKLFITSIIYSDFVFDIYMIDGKLKAFSKNDNISPELLEIVNKSLYDNNDFLRTFIKNIKPLVGVLVFSSALNFLGTYNTSDLDKIDFDNVKVLNTDQIELKEKYTQAVNENNFLTPEDKAILREMYSYIEENYSYFYDIDLMLENVKKLKIIRTETDDDVITGCFKYEYGQPIIYLYDGYTRETIIHEMFHAIKYSKYYDEKTYYYKDRFISKETYEALNDSEKLNCVNYDLKRSSYIIINNII